MGSINKQVTRYGISAVFTHPGAKVDVVLVHGLNGDPEQTWTARNGVFWPADLLPQSLKDVNANILVYGYNADVYSTKSDRSPSSNFIYQHARNLVTDLTFYRKSVGTSANPIIWLAHSLGGLLLKSALLYSNDVKDQNLGDARSVYISTYAIVFLGTPHTGSDMATWGHMLQRMADAVMPRKFLESESVLVKTLKKDNEILQGINSHFLDIYQRLQIHMVHESHKTDIKGTKVMIVDAGSAGPQLPGVTYYGIEATHSGMCKFDDTNAPGYRNVSTAIREWAMEAPVVIQTRWEVEQEQRRSQAHNEAVERTREYGSQVGQYAPLVVSPVGTGSPTLFSPSQAGSQHELPSPREPPFFVPDKFRPNSYFKGREDELQDLHRMLMDKKRRSEGTSAVVIQGIPGAGKTHLARQYVFNYKQHYPGGIYWIRSTSPQDMETEIWRIAKTQAIREMIGQEEKNDLSNPQKMVEIVRKWFNDFSGWLLVLDGIRSDNRLVSEFIPDSKDSSLILTSTERNLAGNHLLDNPRVMELGLLPAQDARELLLEEMGKKPPHSMDDLRRALDLVQLMDRLPLMIHAAAQHMNETREPLAKYLKSYRDKPRVGMLPAYKTIRDQLQNRGDTSALNLMYILCFFSQLVPVEMLALGLKALDKRTPIGRDANGRRQSLNGVFVTLIKFALIERNQMDDIPSTSSQSSHQTIDTSSEPLDVLQIHSVVQAFFIELLGEEKQLEFWLERAVRIFCFSFEEADSRMKKDPTTGLPDDYRRYTIHGKKLLEHLDRHYKSKNADLARVRADLEAILPRLPEEIDSLQRTISTSIVDGKEPVEHLSIFERSNSMSSTSTDTSNGASHPNVGHGTEDKTFESPTTYEIPSRFHVPYPNMLDDQGSRDEDDRTITPYPPDTVLGPYDGTGDEKSDESEWIQVLPRHRSVKKMRSQRYSDHGGAWREVSTNDPRTSISRESAHGLMSTPGPLTRRGGRSPSRPRMSARSDAELELLQISKASPPPPRGGGRIQDRGRSSSTGASAATRPLPNLRTSSYAKVLSGVAVENDAPPFPTFSNPPSRAGTIDRKVASDTLSVNSLRTIDTPTPSYLQRAMGGQSRFSTGPSKNPTAKAAKESPTTQESQDARASPRHKSMSSYLWNFMRSASEPKAGGKKTTRTKPSKDSLKSQSSASPLAQNEFSPTTYKGGMRTANSSPGTQYSPYYPPGLNVVTNNASSLSPEVPEQNYSHGRPTPSYDGSAYYDEALSRSDPSLWHPAVNVSSPATTACMSPAMTYSPHGYTSQPMSRNPSSNLPLPGMTSSSGTPRSSNSGSARAGLGRSRAPSIVETEPSPRVPSLDMAPNSYRIWSQRRGHRRGDSLFGGSNVPASRWLDEAQVPDFEVAQGSPDLMTPRSSQQPGGESMARSGSGGIRVPDGRIIAFGEVPVDVDAAGRRAREERDRLDRAAMDAVDSGRALRAEEAESHSDSSPIGLGIMPG